MTNRRRRAPARKRTTDWTGIIDETLLLGNQTQVNLQLWTPVTLFQEATITRIRGQIGLCCNGLIDVSTQQHEYKLFMGIQVVNRAKGAPGVARSPFNVDDMEGSEWLWLHSAYACYDSSSGTEVPPDSHIQQGFLASGEPVTVDVKAQRKMDLSQDELLLSLVLVGTPTTIDMRIFSSLRMLMKYS